MSPVIIAIIVPLLVFITLRVIASNDQFKRKQRYGEMR